MQHAVTLLRDVAPALSGNHRLGQTVRIAAIRPSEVLARPAGIPHDNALVHTLSEIGAGVFGVAYDAGQDLVVKVSNGVQDGWREWIAWCMVHPGYGRPKVYALYIGNGIFVAVMKKYRAIETHYGDNRYITVRNDGRRLDHLSADYYTLEDDPNDNSREFTSSLSEFGRYLDDVHRSNVMYDPDLDCLIATDPYADTPDMDRIIDLLEGHPNVFVSEENKFRGRRFNRLSAPEDRAIRPRPVLHGEEDNRHRDEARRGLEREMLQMRARRHGVPIHDAFIVRADEAPEGAKERARRLCEIVNAKPANRSDAAGKGLARELLDLARACQDLEFQMAPAIFKVTSAGVQWQRRVDVLPSAELGQEAPAKVPQSCGSGGRGDNVQQRAKRHHPVEPSWTHRPGRGHRVSSSRRARAA